MNIANPSTSFQPIHNLLMGSIAAKAFYSAVELKLFNHLQERSLTVDTLANELSVIPDRLEPVLDLLTASKLLTRNDGTYTNTSLANEFLTSTSPCYQGKSIALTMGFCRSVENSISDLLTGKKLDRSKTDKGWATERTMEGTAQEAIGDGLCEVVNYISALPNFSNARSMCDIGGNHGLYTMGVLSQNPALSGTIYDLPHVVNHTQKRCNEAGFEDRITACELDFRTDPLPANEYDIILMSHALYAFKDHLPETITKVANGLKKGGWFVSHHNAGRQEASYEIEKSALELITRLSGYTSHFIEKEELIGLLKENGFHNFRTHKTSNSALGLLLVAQKKS